MSTPAIHDFFGKIVLKDPQGTELTVLKANSVIDTVTIESGVGVSLETFNQTTDTFKIDVDYDLFVPVGTTQLRLQDVNANTKDISLVAGTGIQISRASESELVLNSFGVAETDTLHTVAVRGRVTDANLVVNGLTVGLVESVVGTDGMAAKDPEFVGDGTLGSPLQLANPIITTDPYSESIEFTTQDSAGVLSYAIAIDPVETVTAYSFTLEREDPASPGTYTTIESESASNSDQLIIATNQFEETFNGSVTWRLTISVSGFSQDLEAQAQFQFEVFDLAADPVLETDNTAGAIKVRNILPAVNEQFDIGSSSLRFRDIYLSGNTIFLGESKIAVDTNGNFEFTDSNDNKAQLGLGANTTDDLTEGATNLYYTDSRARNAVSAVGDLSYNSATGVFSATTYKSTNFDTDFGNKTTNDLTEGTTNLYYTDSRARNAVSASNGLSYNTSTGIFSNTAPDQVVALTGSGATSVSGTYPNFTISSTDTTFSAGTGLDLIGTTFSIDNTVVSTSGDQTINGVKTFSSDAIIHGLTIGRGAGGFSTNVAVGIEALFNNSSSQGNIAVGRLALRGNINGDNNIAVGYRTLRENIDGDNNIAVGRDALYNNTTGKDNVAVGHTALRDNTTGENNVAVGTNALFKNTVGSNSTAIGRAALRENTTGVNNTAVGYRTLIFNTTGDNNTALGFESLHRNNSGTNNTAIGSEALYDGTIGNHNTAIGSQALRSNRNNCNTAIGSEALRDNYDGFNNTATGYYALRENFNGEENTASGFQALQNNANGHRNTAVGSYALQSNTSGDRNTAVGNQALQNNTSVSNTAVGNRALESNTTGNSNTALGTSALMQSTTSDDNTAIGSAALFSNDTGNSNTAIGYTALYNSIAGINNTAVGFGSLLNSTGNNNIGIGSNAGTLPGLINVTNQDNLIVMGNNDHTDAYIRIAWTVTSDARDKTEFAPVPHGLDFVNALQPTEYQFKAGSRDGDADGIKRYGFLAQDILALENNNPVLVDASDPDNLKLKESQLVPVLVKAIQELTARLTELENKQ